MKLSPKQQGHLIMLFVMTIFGLNIPVTKEIYIFHYMTPFALTTVRIVFGAVMFWIASLFFPQEKVSRKDMLVLLGGGLCGTILNQGLFAYGLQNSSPVDASIITTSSPLFAMLIAAVILSEPITFKKAGGVVLGAMGAIWLVYQGKHIISSTNTSSALGNISIVTSQFFYAFYLVVTKPLSSRYSPITMMKWMFSFAAVALLPFTWRETASSRLFVSGDATGYQMLAFVLFGATFFTFLMIPMAQQRIRATTISAYNNLQPMIASLVAIWMGMDKFTMEKLLAGCLILGGVYMVTISKSRDDLLREKQKPKDLEQK
jgi:drug/metabolite transporter (DMT)-like permease